MTKLIIFMLLISMAQVVYAKEKVSINECAKLIDAKKYYKARDLCKKLAKKDDAVAQFNLGTLYYNGYGVMTDQRLAYKWISKSANNNHSKAQYNKAIMLANGQGVEADLVQAFAWITIASNSGYDEAKEVKKNMEEELTKKEKTAANVIVDKFKDKSKAK